MNQTGLRPIEIIVTTVLVGLLVSGVWFVTGGRGCSGFRFGGHPGGSRRASCLSQIRQIGLAARMYADQNKNHFPWVTGATSPAEQVYGNLALLCYTNYLDDARVLMCPSDGKIALDPFDPDTFVDGDPSTYLRRGNCSYSMDLQPDTKMSSDPVTAILSDMPEGTFNSVIHGYKRGGILGEGQNVYRIGGDAKWFLTPENPPDDNIFSDDPLRNANDGDSWIPDVGP